MAEYYAIERSPTYLFHYGVKGMKWGVRRALKKGNQKKLGKHYVKASKKLAKLQNNANPDYQRDRIRNASFKQKSAFGASMAKVGAINALGLAASHVSIGPAITASNIAVRQIGKARAKKLASQKGHAKAVRKEERFRNEMTKAFSGTPYGEHVGELSNSIAAKKRRRVERTVNRLNKASAAYARYGPRHSGRRYNSK